MPICRCREAPGIDLPRSGASTAVTNRKCVARSWVLLGAVLVSLSSPAAGAPCPVSLSYEVSLGQETTGSASTAFGSVPIFFGKLSIYSNNATIDTWRLGWNFTNSESLKQAQDIFTEGVTPVLLANSTVQLESYDANNTIIPFESLAVSFLANKNLQPDPSNPYGVAPLSGVAFNNLLCSKLPLTATQGPQPQAIAVPSNSTLQEPSPLLVEYAPIVYINQANGNGDWTVQSTSTTTVLLRVSNIGGDEVVTMDRINLQYWFNGPDNTLETSDPLSLFYMDCLDTTTGCGTLLWNISQGLEGTQGARYVLNLGFNRTAGLLLNETQYSVDSGTPDPRVGLEVMEVLVRINTRQFLTSMNSTQDFSYLDTPRTNVPITDTTTIVPRQAEVNTRIPAYLDNTLAWGGVPVKEAEAPVAAPTPAPSPAGALPLGITCVAAAPVIPGSSSSAAANSSSLGQVCGLSASYCCYGDHNAPVESTIPAQWPPGPFGIPQDILESNSEATCPAGNCTGGETPTTAPAESPVAPVATNRLELVGPRPASPVVVGSPPPPGLPPPATSLPINSTVPGPGPTTAFTSKQTPESNGGSSSNTGIIAGVIAGGVAVVLTSLLGLFLYRRKRQLYGSWSRGGEAIDHDLKSVTSQDVDQDLPRHDLVKEASLESNQSSVSSNTRVQKALLSRPGRSGRLDLGRAPRPLASVLDSPYTPSPNWRTGRFESELNGHAAPQSTRRTLMKQMRGSIDAPELRYGGNGQSLTAFLAKDLQGAHWGANPFQVTRTAEDDLRIGSHQILGNVPAGQGLGALRRVHSMPKMRVGENADLLSSLDPIWWDETSRSRSSGQTLWRRKSWGGILMQAPGWEAKAPGPHARGLPYRRQTSTFLPPLKSLPPPPSLSLPPAANIDLYVDFETELKPFLSTCLGTGGFGSVYRARWRGRDVAVKCLPNLAEGGSNSTGGTLAQYEALVREIELSCRFNSPRLVKVYGASLKSHATCCLIMELAAGGNLHQRIYDTNRPRMTLIEALQITHDVAEGLAYLHPSVIHRDLKPQNILLDEYGRAKIADFGISRVKDPAKTYLTATNDNGTPMYMAPEQFNGSHLDEKVDVYALACILNECLTRRQPWREAPNFFQIIVQVAIKGLRPPLDATAPEPVRRLITKCWAQDARSRPSCAEIMRLTDIILQQERRGALGQGSAGSLEASRVGSAGSELPRMGRSLRMSHGNGGINTARRRELHH